MLGDTQIEETWIGAACSVKSVNTVYSQCKCTNTNKSGKINLGPDYQTDVFYSLNKTESGIKSPLIVE